MRKQNKTAFDGDRATENGAFRTLEEEKNRTNFAHPIAKKANVCYNKLNCDGASGEATDHLMQERNVRMNTIRFDNQNTLMVAHRGVSGLERENTAAAFIAAGNRSYYGVETDIWRTSDGHFVVSHDGTAQRVSGVNAGMETTPWPLLREIVLYDMDNTHDRYDLRLPSLENYITICRRYEKYCVLELKSAFTPEETAALVELIRGYDYLDHTIFISFNYDNLLQVRALLPEQPCQFLTGDNSDDLIARLKADRMDIDILHTSLTEERVNAMHAAGLKINCWTVDDPARGAELAAWGVDFITSNILEGK